MVAGWHFYVQTCSHDAMVLYIVTRALLGVSSVIYSMWLLDGTCMCKTFRHDVGVLCIVTRELQGGF